MEVRKVLDSKSDLDGKSRSLVLVPFNRQHRFAINLPLQLCLYFEILSVISQNFIKEVHDPEHIAIGKSCIHWYS